MRASFLAPILALACGTWLAAGCSSGEERTPAACRDGVSAVRAALRAAPSDVRLEGRPLSACLHAGSDGGALNDVGAAYVNAAAELAEAADARPHGPEATQLGYLVGATRRGSANAQGVTSELIRRLEQELLRVNTRTKAFVRGERAGRSGG